MCTNERRTQMILQKLYLYCIENVTRAFILWLFILNVTPSVWSYLVLVIVKDWKNSGITFKSPWLKQYQIWTSLFCFTYWTVDAIVQTVHKKSVSMLVEIFHLVGVTKIYG